MKIPLWVAGIGFAVMLTAAARGTDKPEGAHIRGIAGVRMYTSDIRAARKFYQDITETGRSCDWCETQAPSAFRLPSGQFILLSYVHRYDGKDMLAEVSFDVQDLEELEKIFKKYKIKHESDRRTGVLTMVRAQDPEGHQLAFLDLEAARKYHAYYPKNTQDSALKEKILHAGFVVEDRERMDQFYKDVLGFHVYWHGGMHDDETNWVDMQVPEGTDWIEYMLGVPENASQHTLGVMNHIALGVPSVEAAAEQLRKNGRKLAEPPKIGRDGKWQLNLYDPDETRVEFMEFTPIERPCCSEYAGQHPVP